MNTPRRPLVAVVAALALALPSAGTALAHAELSESDPADKAALETPPTAITLTFSEELDPAKSSFKLLGPDGAMIGTGSATGDDVMSLPGLALAPGAYLIQWTSASAEDGDIDRGELTFTVLAASAAPSTAPSTSSEPSAAPSSSAPAASPTPAASAGTDPASGSGGDVLLPIIVGLLLVAGVGAFVLRRSRGS